MEFPEDVWTKIKLFRPVTYVDLDKDSFIIKDVVLEYICCVGDGYIEQRNVFKFVDDIIYSKNFLLFKQYSKVIVKNKNDFLIYIDECFCPDLKFNKNELYKCNIKILKLYDDDGNEYDYESIYTHDAELKYCEPCYNYNDLDLNINNTNNNMDEVNIKNDSEHYISENNNTNLENTLNTNFYNNNMSSENDLNISFFNNNMSSENDLNINFFNNNNMSSENDLNINFYNNNNMSSENSLNINFLHNNMSSENDLINSNFENKISSNIIMSKARQRNSKYLNGLVNKISKKIKNEEITTQAKKVSNLYNEGYIVNTTTAQNILLKMLAGVSYKKEYDKVIPKAETHKEIKQPPNIGIRKRRAQNKTPKQKEPPKPQQPPGSLTRNISAEGYEMDENKAFALSEEERFYKIQYNKRKDDEGGPSET
jgi:hypothetical protein